MSVSLAKPDQAPRVKPHATVACHTLDDVHSELKRQTLAAKRVDLLAAVEPTYLSVTWGISRAQDTYGYNRVQVQDVETNKRFSACGGGYDMLGSAFGEWLQKTHQSLLLAYSDMAHDTCVQYEQGKPWQRTENRQGLYGMTLNTRLGVQDISLDGGCGLDCMIKIARAIGLTVDPVKTYNRKGQSTGISGWYVKGVNYA
jgi:hypothetical protein